MSLLAIRLAYSTRLFLFARTDGPEKIASSESKSQNKSLETFDLFFRQYSSAVFGYLWRMTGEEQAANDLTQETFIRAWKQFSHISTYDQPRAWLLRVATHLALNYRRQSVRHHEIQWQELHDEEYDAPLAADHTVQIVNRDDICRILLTLPARERSALVLHAVYGLSCAELSEALHISVAAAKIALWRGRPRFRAHYSGEEDTNEKR